MSSPYDIALKAIDDAHSADPKKVSMNGSEVPYELHYAQKMSGYLAKRAPDASETLRLAIRSQHLRRWEVPRDSYPMTKVGYFSWRTFLKKRQAEIAQKILLDAGYGQDDAERVAALVRKEDLKSDEETQILEDVACLVFLDDQFEDFEKEHDEAKMIGILQKTWKKMTPEGHALALKIPMADRCQELVKKALGA